MNPKVIEDIYDVFFDTMLGVLNTRYFKSKEIAHEHRKEREREREINKGYAYVQA